MKSLTKALKKVSPLKLAVMYSLPFTAVFTVLIAAIIVWEKKNQESDVAAELREAARAYFEQILITRLWNADHSGVYVEVTEKSQPNPYLKDDPNRDIITVGGRKYTKINPAYMTRQISEIAERKGRYKFHITSLRPVNPNNQPDEWERRELRLFEEGKKIEAYEVIKENGAGKFRYMAPLFVEDACLQCHQKHGYNPGDVRGGISIDIPMGVMTAAHTAIAKRSIIAFGIIGIVSWSFIFAATLLLSKKIVHNIEREIENERLKTAIQLAGAAAHELRQPMTIIIGFSELLNDKMSKGESIGYELDIIVQQCLRMNEIIKRMVGITKYKTKTYSDDMEIFDLEVQPDSKEPDSK